MTANLSSHGTACPIGSAVYGEVQVGLNIFDHDLGQTFQHHLRVAAFVSSAARAIDVGKPHHHTPNVIIRAGKGELKSTLDMATHCVGE